MPKETVNRKVADNTTEKKVNKKPSKPVSPYLIIAILLVLVLGGGYYIFRSKENARYHEQQLNVQIASNQQQISQLTAQLQQLSLQQDQLLGQIRSHTFANRLWVLSEICYLLQQAQLKLTIEHNIPTALILLKTAAAQVAPIKSESVKSLSLVINKDIKMLRAIKRVDLTVLGKQFGLLMNNINNLSLSFSQLQQQEVAPRNHHQQLWQKALSESWNTLRKVIVVQRINDSFTPLVQRQQLVTFKQYLQSLAQQAFWGALHHDTGVYQQSLTQIKAALHQYMLPNNEAMQAIQIQLQQLQTMQITPALPAKLAALAVARELQTKEIITRQGKAK